MSIAISSRVWARSKARGSVRLVALALGDYANDDGEAWPSVASLAAKTLLHPTNVRRALRWLEQAGEIVRLDAGKGGRRNSTTYRVMPEQNPSAGARLSEPGNPSAGAHETRAQALETRALVNETRARALANPLEPSRSINLSVKTDEQSYPSSAELIARLLSCETEKHPSWPWSERFKQWAALVANDDWFEGNRRRQRIIATVKRCAPTARTIAYVDTAVARELRARDEDDRDEML
jgi:hypothetical protein